MTQIQGLIDKKDNFEIIRDKIGQILINEITQQKAFATASGKDASLWDVNIYLERSNPFEQYLNPEPDVTPIVNIFTDNLNLNASSSGVVERQTVVGIFNIDCYALGIAQNSSTGFVAGDEQASYNVQRTVRLVRNILFSSYYTYLDLRGLVGKRWIQSINFYQPEVNLSSIQKIYAARISLMVDFNEFSPQYQGEELDYIAVDIHRARDGKLIAEADYDYTGV